MIPEHIEQIEQQLAAAQRQAEGATGARAEALENIVSVLSAELAEWTALGHGAPTPEQAALQAKAQEQRQIAANMRAQATADAILQTLPPDPTPDDHDAVAEQLERAAQGEQP